jgi:ribosome-binding factor A
MREFQRTERLGAELRRELAAILQQEVRDPRLGMITIQEVRVTKNLADAKIFFTCLNNDVKTVNDLLNHTMINFLRRELAHRTKMRTIPQLHFVYDESIEHGVHLTNLIHQVVSDETID